MLKELYFIFEAHEMYQNVNSYLLKGLRFPQEARVLLM